MELLSVAGVHRWIENALGDPWDGDCRHLLTINSEYVVRSRQDTAFANAIVDGDLRIADGIGIIYAAWLLAGHQARLLQRVTGVDVVEWLTSHGGSGPAIFLLGGRDDAGERVAMCLSTRQTGARVVGWWSGGTADRGSDGEALQRIARSGATAIFVAYGAPDQVLWIQRNRDALAEHGIRLAVGVGGAFDYLAGVVPRAPRWMRRAGLEWLYRLNREPWRWRRQLALPWFVILVLGQRLGMVRPIGKDV